MKNNKIIKITKTKKHRYYNKLEIAGYSSVFSMQNNIFLKIPTLRIK